MAHLGKCPSSWLVGTVIGVFLSLLLGVGFVGSAFAEDPASGKRALPGDAILVSQVIAWSLYGPVSADEAAPVHYKKGVAPVPMVSGRDISFKTDNIILSVYSTPDYDPNVRLLEGVIQLKDILGHRVVARFKTKYYLQNNGVFHVTSVTVQEITSPSPRVDAFFVPASIVSAEKAWLQPHFDLLSFVSKNAVPLNTRDKAERDYVVYLFSLDRLPISARLEFVVLTPDDDQEVARALAIQENGWYVATKRLWTALNGEKALYFKVYYTPAEKDGAASRQRIITAFSNLFATVPSAP